MTKSGKHCGYVFKKPSAAEASESVYMMERVKGFGSQIRILEHCLFMIRTFDPGRYRVVNSCQTIGITYDLLHFSPKPMN